MDQEHCCRRSKRARLRLVQALTHSIFLDYVFAMVFRHDSLLLISKSMDLAKCRGTKHMTSWRRMFTSQTGSVHCRCLQSPHTELNRSVLYFPLDR